MQLEITARLLSHGLSGPVRRGCNAFISGVVT
jgi:hypothetical protein